MTVKIVVPTRGSLLEGIRAADTAGDTRSFTIFIEEETRTCKGANYTFAAVPRPHLMKRIDDAALDQLFRDARTYNAWLPKPVSVETLRALYDLMKWGPTSANTCPLRIVFVQSREAKERLVACMNPGNVDKTRQAPVTAVLGMDMEFYEKLPQLFPHTDARSWFAGKPAVIESTAFRNSSLQGGYFILARAPSGSIAGRCPASTRTRSTRRSFRTARSRSTSCATSVMAIQRACWHVPRGSTSTTPAGSSDAMTIGISSSFDGGSIEVVAIEGARADLAIRHDLAADGTRSEFLQWFHFRVSGAERDGARLRVVNAGQTTYAGGWRDYRAVASWDRRCWERIPTAFDGEVMTIELPPAPGPSYIAYFEPYAWERHLALLADSCARGAALRRLGSTVQGRDLDALVVGEGASAVWIIGRQHPGETMAEWFIDGLLARLLDAADPIGRALRRQATLHIVPNMNPDGSVLGNLRTNAAGANLNREWLAPTVERSPEVLRRARCDSRDRVRRLLRHPRRREPALCVRRRVRDVAELQRTPACRTGALQRRFHRREPGFPDDPRLFAGQVQGRRAETRLEVRRPHLRLPVLTLEMPFKDNANAPDPRIGWSAARSQRLGAAMLGPVWRHLQRA